MNENHEPGKCHCCYKETMVRWKNIYHMGSEGLWICMECERKLLKFIENLKRESFLKKRDYYKKINRNYYLNNILSKTKED